MSIFTYVLYTGYYYSILNNKDTYICMYTLFNLILKITALNYAFGDRTVSFFKLYRNLGDRKKLLWTISWTLSSAETHD